MADEFTSMTDALTIATWALVGATALYAFLTWRILRQNGRLIAAQTRPRVIAFAEANEKQAIFFVVENQGMGPAKDVQIGVPLEWSGNADLGNLGRIGFVAKGISLLPAGRRLHSFIAVGKDINTGTLRPFVAQLRYVDASGKAYAEEFTIDLSEMTGIRPSDHQAAGNLVGAR